MKRSHKGRSTQRESPARRVQSTPPEDLERRQSTSHSRRRGRSLTRDLEEEDSSQATNTAHIVVNLQILAPTMARPFAFAPFNQGSPLDFAVHHDIPLVALKSILDFTSEGKTTAFEHIRDVTTIYSIHNITHEDVATKLLAASFKGKALEWLRTLAVSSINSWDRLGDTLSKHFDKLDNLSLVKKLTTIKRDPQEQMTDYNSRFLRTWNRIPATVRPSADHAFLYYLQSLNGQIFVMIQSMGGNTLPQAFDIVVRAKNCLIQTGMIARRPLMPIFLVFSLLHQPKCPHSLLFLPSKHPKLVLVAKTIQGQATLKN